MQTTSPTQPSLFGPTAKPDRPLHPWVAVLYESRAKELREASRATYEAWWAQYLLWLEKHHVQLEHASSADVETFLQSENRAFNTRLRYFRLLRDIFDAVVRAGLLAKSPISAELSLQYLKEEETVPSIGAPPETAQRIFECANAAKSWKQVRDWAMVGLVAEAGLRRSEVLSLEWRKLTLRHPRALLELSGPARKETFMLELSEPLTTLMQRWFDKTPAPKGKGQLMFPAKAEGTRMDPATCHRATTRCYAELGLVATDPGPVGEKKRPGRRGRGGLSLLRSGLALQEKQLQEGSGQGSEKRLQRLREQLGHVRAASTIELVNKAEPPPKGDKLKASAEGAS